MRIMIAGADISTLIRLKWCLSNFGHKSEIVRNGPECRAGLYGFVPDLLLMELDIFWSGYDGVMATLIDAPQLHEIPVVFFTEIYKQLPPEVFPRVIARLRSPFQSQELFRLRKLLDNMECAHVVDLLSRQQTSQLTAKRGSSILAKTEGGGIRHATFKAPSIFTDHR